MLNRLPAHRPTPRVQANAERLDSEIVYDRDFDYDYFGFKTLERSYLLRVNGKVVERPQHMLMRVAVGIHGEDVEAGASLVPAATHYGVRQLPLRHAAPGPSAGSSPSLAAFCTDRLLVIDTACRSTWLQPWRPTTCCRSAGSRMPRPRCSMLARRARSSPPAS